ncbi:MAG: hypothetical protein IK099_03245 [Clostridia bacterium]|nr:hypothetical protein [Clostridia bacterium]
MEKQNTIISKLQNGLNLVLADASESCDKNTGDHVRKTAPYADVATQSSNTRFDPNVVPAFGHDAGEAEAIRHRCCNSLTVRREKACRIGKIPW